ncbi:hypothetical protein SDC9_102506 [bioreactor metagenome]|uniref:Lipoprotein n=1 Tax=bioreactor metagenome TaxID=1076179 RepID=A0A645ARM1_9ZZZZ
MKKTTKVIGALLLCMGLLTGCKTEVAEFESIKDAIETAEKEEKEAQEETKKEKTPGERLNDPDTINVENNEELKSILEKSVDAHSVKHFFENNEYNIIEFDGNIDYIELISGKKTRYSMLFRSGNYEDQKGPVFIVKDIGAADPAVRELFTAGNGEQGKNVKIKAKIYGYVEGSDAIELKLESISIR